MPKKQTKVQQGFYEAGPGFFSATSSESLLFARLAQPLQNGYHLSFGDISYLADNHVKIVRSAHRPGRQTGGLGLSVLQARALISSCFLGFEHKATTDKFTGHSKDTADQVSDFKAQDNRGREYGGQEATPLMPIPMPALGKRGYYLLLTVVSIIETATFGNIHG